MKTILALLAAVFLFPGLVSAAGERSVLIISIDALHPDALGPRTTPRIYALMKAGAFTLDGRSTDPPLTLLSHSAMFSGIGPGAGGRKENAWHPGQPVISTRTIFDDAKAKGFTTGFFYSKQKLGYLVTRAVDRHQLDREFSVDNAMNFFKGEGAGRFCILHISGLDRAGPEEGWLSEGYMEELFLIDDSLDPLIRTVTSASGYLIIVTSDHAGHGRIHGTSHPEDAKLPLVMASDRAELGPYQDMPYHVTDLRSILRAILP